MSLMVTKTNMIKELTSLKDDWCIKVMIIRLGKLTVFKNTLETWEIEMVLQDEEESKIVATVKQNLIGDLTSCGNIEHTIVEGNKPPFAHFKLEGITGTKLRNITLWSDYVEQLNNALGDQHNLCHVVIILQFMKQKIYKRESSFESKPVVSSMFGARKLLIENDIPDLHNFKKLLIENFGLEGDDHCVTHTTTFSSYSIKHYFLNNLQKVTLNDIRDIGKVMSCIVVATVKKIERESDWWYLACVKCNHCSKQQNVLGKYEYGVVVRKMIVFMCTNKECSQATEVEHKYKIPLLVMDSNGSVSLTLFERQGHPILDKSAVELVQEVRKEQMSGIPNHRLALKFGGPVMLLRNIDRTTGLCNGTRLRILKLGEHVIEAQIITGTHVGHTTIIPRLKLGTSDKRLTLKTNRRQFPVDVCFKQYFERCFP